MREQLGMDFFTAGSVAMDFGLKFKAYLISSALPEDKTHDLGIAIAIFCGLSCQNAR